VAAVVPMPVGDDGMPWHFRHKSTFVFDRGPSGTLVMGHHAAGGRTVVPVDMFPHTPHVEAVVVFDRVRAARGASARMPRRQ